MITHGAGWQVYFVCNDKIVGCMSKNFLIARELKNVATFPQNAKWLAGVAQDLLARPHLLDHLGKVSVSVVFHTPEKAVS